MDSRVQPRLRGQYNTQGLQSREICRPATSEIETSARVTQCHDAQKGPLHEPYRRSHVNKSNTVLYSDRGSRVETKTMQHTERGMPHCRFANKHNGTPPPGPPAERTL